MLTAALTFGVLMAMACDSHIQQSPSRAEGITPHPANGATGNGMVLIPAATMQMGVEASESPRLQKIFDVGPRLFEAAIPKHSVTLGSFYIDLYLVTNEEFKRFIDKNPGWERGRIPARLHNGSYLKHWNANEYPPHRAEHPVVNISWYAAVAYCHWAVKRLPTEAEWAHAARGGLTALFPWGDEPVDKPRANYSGSGLGTTTLVGSYPANRYGLFDMAGNVWQFVADEWGPYSPSTQINPIAGGDLFQDGDSFLRVRTRRVIRGGSWGGAPINLWVDYRDSHPPDGAQEFVGFRCAMSAQ
jgi:formylglycine-generating enzyme required for sulfatase activity